jgi:uncharacterized membrane protein
MTAGTGFWTIATILLWGTIPILDKLALSQPGVAPLVGIAIRATSVALLSAPLVWIFHDPTRWRADFNLFAVLCFAASGVVSLLLAQYCYYNLLKDADVSRIFPFLFGASPLVTMVLGYLCLGETLQLKHLIGAAFIIAGSLMLL